MLELTSPRWTGLAQAFGSADDIPLLLGALSILATDEERAEVWFGLWATLCPPEHPFTAAYAAAPHLLALTADSPTSERARALHLVAQIEVSRAAGNAPSIPADLLADYAAAVESMPAIVAECSSDPWTAEVAQVMSAALLVGKRQPRLARLLLDYSEGTD